MFFFFFNLPELDFNVRGNAESLYGTSVRRIVAGNRQFEPGPVPHGFYSLDRTLAKGGCAENKRPRMVLKSSGDDFRGARASTVDKDYNGVSAFFGLRVSFIDLVVSAAPPLNGYNVAVFQKTVSHFHGLIQETSRVVSQVENQTLQGRVCGFELLQGLFQIFCCIVPEVCDASISISILKDKGSNALKGNGIAGNYEILWFFKSLPDHCNGYRSPFGSPHLFDRLFEHHILCIFTINLDDLVARLYSCTVSRGSLYG